MSWFDDELRHRMYVVSRLLHAHDLPWVGSVHDLIRTHPELQQWNRSDVRRALMELRRQGLIQMRVHASYVGGSKPGSSLSTPWEVLHVQAPIEPRRITVAEPTVYRPTARSASDRLTAPITDDTMHVLVYAEAGISVQYDRYGASAIISASFVSKEMHTVRSEATVERVEDVVPFLRQLRSLLRKHGVSSVQIEKVRAAADRLEKTLRARHE